MPSVAQTCDAEGCDRQEVPANRFAARTFALSGVETYKRAGIPAEIVGGASTTPVQRVEPGWFSPLLKPRMSCVAGASLGSERDGDAQPRNGGHAPALPSRRHVPLVEIDRDHAKDAGHPGSSRSAASTLKLST